MHLPQIPVSYNSFCPPSDRGSYPLIQSAYDRSSPFLKYCASRLGRISTGEPKARSSGRVRNSAGAALLFLLLILTWDHKASGAGSVLCRSYHCHNGVTDECQPEICAYDDIVWDNLSIDVGADTPAGVYEIQAYNYTLFFTQRVNLVVDENGDYTIDLTPNGGNYWGGNCPNEQTITWGVWRDGMPVPDATVEADQVVIQSAVCEPRTGELRHGRISVSLGDSVLPAEAGSTKECDANTGCATCPTTPMASYSLHLMLASLHIQDSPISYNCGRGPSPSVRIVYNQREANQPSSFTYSNFGPKWTFNWLSYVTDSGPAGPAASVTNYARGGGTESYSGYDPATHSYEPDKQSLAVLVRTSDSSYEKQFSDGSKEVFSVSDNSESYPRRVFLSSVVDARGNAVSLAYDSSLRVTSITDALGQITLVSHVSDDPGVLPDYYRIENITDPFGRIARFEYGGDGGQLSQITDPGGIESKFFYQPGTDFINRMQTPYGDTTFSTGETGDVSRWIEVTDPEGGRERVEYQDAVAAVPAADPIAPDGVFNGALDRRNTFYWDKRAMADGAGDYTKARIIHWLKSADGGKISGIKHSEKSSLENRVWHNYSTQSNQNRVGANGRPTRIVRVLDDGRSQASHFEYNALGNPTKFTDPKNRVTSYEYAGNGIDLIGVYQEQPGGESIDPFNMAADKITGYGSYYLHRPLSMTDAALQTTNYTYNAFGQVTDVENPRGERTHYDYGSDTAACSDVPNGYLVAVTGPLFEGQSALTTLRYDCARRIQAVTNHPDLYTVTTEYDDLDRPTQIIYPDNSARQFKYTEYTDEGIDTGKKLLDLTRSIDRQGRVTDRHYDGNRRMDWIKDPLLRKTGFDWCTCGSLDAIVDPDGNVTKFDRDLQSRVLHKTFGFGTTEAETVSYVYENTTSRLKSMTDAMNQTTNYQYDVDDNLRDVTYAGAQNPTPNISYAYDDYYNRTQSLTSSGSGVINGTIGYTYYPVTVAGTLGANRPATVGGLFDNDTITFSYDELGRKVGQSINGVASTMVFDSLGRPDTSDNSLGHFTRTYENGVTPRLQTLEYPNGQAANRTYFGNDHDRRLQTLRNLAGGGATSLSQFDYTYDSEGTIQTQDKLLGTIQTNLVFGYDSAQQLRSVVQGNIQFQYEYDGAGNRLSDLFHTQFSHGGSTFSANHLNQLDSITRDPGHGPAAGPFPITYDANGNMTYDGGKQSYEWDAANRLLAINYTETGDRTEFAYDGLGRRVKISEYGPGVTAVVQPKDETYVPFGTAEFNLPTGAYEVKFEGLNPNGGNNTALIDGVMLDQTPVPNGGFEIPALTEDTIAPAASGWGYFGSAGIASPNGSIMNGGPPAPEGVQAAFVSNYGSLWQFGSVTPLTYSLSFQVAQQAVGNDSSQQLRVTLRGAVSTKTFVWSGNTIAEERDATGANVTKRFFAEGEQRIGGKDAGLYYYSRDHLGSIREVADANGDLVAQYDYGAWGNEVAVNGKMPVDFGYTGHYYHQPSGMNLTLYRAYSPTLARWLNRDRIGEQGGLNLYRYVSNDPVVRIDLLGLDETFWEPDHGRSWSDGPRNGNYGGKNWTGGRGPGETGPLAPPTDSADNCYCQHDRAYGKCEGLMGDCKQECIRRADAQLLACLNHLPDDSRLWPAPPRPGTERDSEIYRELAIYYFGRQFGL
jgi:RHS repeat-associated protein